MAKKQTRTKGGQFKSNRSVGVDNPSARAGERDRIFVLERIWQRAVAEGKAELKNRDAQNWFRSKASKVGDSKKRIFADAQKRARRRRNITPGRMYFFRYKAKYAEELPYWDAVPIIFPFWEDSKHFLGINLHYLAPQIRAILMGKLLNLRSDDRFDERTKLRMSYKMLSEAAKFREIHPCVKKYLKTNVQSEFIEVYSYEWFIAIFLPLASWRKASPQRVYTDSKKKIRGKR